MDFLFFAVFLGAIFGCFPANLRFILGKESLTPLKLRHYLFTVTFMLLFLVQSVEMMYHITERYWSLRTSEKMSVIIAVVSFFIFDIYFRLYGIIYGHTICRIISDLRKIKAKFGEMSGAVLRRRERKWFTFGAALVLTMQLFYVPLRVVDWYDSHETLGYGFFIYPTTPVLLYPFIFLTEVSGLASRSFAVGFIAWTGLELLECYQLLNTSVQNLQNLDKLKPLEKKRLKSLNTQQSLLIDHSANGTSERRASDTSEKVLMEQFTEIRSCFHRFNYILGSYAFIILVWVVGNLLIEIRALPSTDRNTATFFGTETSELNAVASILGTLFGLVVTYLICLLGHRIEYAVRKNREKTGFLRLLNPELCGGKIYECLSLFKWEFTAKGLFVINLSLIPRIAGAIFSVTIFHLQLEISERQFPGGGQSSFPSEYSESIFSTTTPAYE